MNTNPAGLAQITTSRMDLMSAIAYGGNTRHEDTFGNDLAISNDTAVLGNFGYARHLADWPVTVGIALFAQGGAGIVYEDMNTAFGTSDDIENIFRVARITPGIAWQVNDNLSLGASIVGTYSDLEQRIFPDTSFFDPSDPMNSFFGLQLEDMSTFNTGVKFGAMYRVDKRLTLGAAYTSQVDLELDGGTLTADMSAIGLGKVTYRDAEAFGINQPQELGIGAALKMTDTLLLAAEINWIDWSSAVKSGTLRASKPDNPAAPPMLELIAEHDWRDQYVIALGMVYDWDNQTVVRAGYNYGRNPVPDENLVPFLAPITEHHLTFGFGRILNNIWRIDAAFEWDIHADATYTNPAAPFGPDAKEEVEFFSLHLMVSRLW